jgi:segregation and condensation protein B
MTEEHTQQADNSETFSASAVATAEASTNEPAPENESDDVAAAALTHEPDDEPAVSDEANVPDEPVADLDADILDQADDELSDDLDTGMPIEMLPTLVEALLFVADQPIDVNAIARALEVTPLRARRALDQLAESLRDNERGMRLQVGPDGAQLVTAPETATVVERFLGLEASRRLSNAALETLAIIAYRQPVTRHVVDQIRGVDSGGALATLRARNLIEAVGRAPGPGRPVLFSTTQRFLEHFGLEHAQDLPALPDDLELPPEDAGAQLALDQAISTELTTNEDPEQTTIEPPIADIDSPDSADDAVDQDELDETVFDVDDDDVEISSDLDDLSRAAGAAFGTNDGPDGAGD